MNTSSKTVLKISLALNLIVVVLDTIGIVQGLGRPGQSMFLFYTEDSNILSLAACACFSVCTILILSGRLSEMPRWAQILKYMAACCLTLTFLVVVCVLAPMNGADGYQHMLIEGQFLYFHLLCPILVFISFVFFEKKPRLDRKAVRYAVIPTLVYAAIVIVLNITGTITGPYPFLMVREQPVWQSILWCVAILGGDLLISELVRRANAAGGAA